MFCDSKLETIQADQLDRIVNLLKKLHFSRIKEEKKETTHSLEQHNRLHTGMLVGMIAMASTMLTACGSSGDGGIESQVSQNDPTWQAEVLQRRQKIEQTIHHNHLGFEAFDTGSVGDATLEMIPFVVFRILQELEPSVFGDDALKSYGFFERKDVPSGLNGITWTRPIQPIKSDIGNFELRYFTRTCASCHTGRIRLDDGQIRVLNGAANTEMRVHNFEGQRTKVLKERLTDSNDSPQYKTFKNNIIDMLKQKDIGWYWGTDPSIPENDIKKEVETVSANIDAVLTQMRVLNDYRLSTLGLLQKYSYDKVSNPPSLIDGAPGIVETAGLGSAALIPVVGETNAAKVLPPGPAKADILSVWKLDSTGYANWDGIVKGYSRALTSSLALVGDPQKIDLEANKKIQAFLAKLPSEPFPFNVDIAAAKRGEAIFNANCLVCHDPAAGRSRDAMIFDVQTDPARAMATSSMAAQELQKLVSSVCPKDQECIVADPVNKRGYVAGSLAGIWAQAPYLHNGSVPTLRQLLVPALRQSGPFLRGSVSYDAKNGGWEWDPKKENALREKGDVAISLHNINQSGMKNFGHGSVEEQFISVGNSKVRVAWSDSEEDKKIVDDLIAYLLKL